MTGEKDGKGYSRTLREWVPTYGDRVSLMAVAAGMFDSVLEASGKSEFREFVMCDRAQVAFDAAMVFLAKQFESGALSGGVVVSKVEFEHSFSGRGSGTSVNLRQFPLEDMEEVRVENVGRVDVLMETAVGEQAWVAVQLWDVSGVAVGCGWVLKSEVRDEDSGQS